MAFRHGLGHADSRRAGHSTTVLACCCMIAMAAGALLCYQFALSATVRPLPRFQCVPRRQMPSHIVQAARGQPLRRSLVTPFVNLQLPAAVPAARGMLRRSAVEVRKAPIVADSDGRVAGNDAEVLLPKKVEAPKVKAQRAASYEEAVQASGLLDTKPAARAGDSGHTSYVVQPMQLLSLYPRRAGQHGHGSL